MRVSFQLLQAQSQLLLLLLLPNPSRLQTAVCSSSTLSPILSLFSARRRVSCVSERGIVLVESSRGWDRSEHACIAMAADQPMRFFEKSGLLGRSSIASDQNIEACCCWLWSERGCERRVSSSIEHAMAAAATNQPQSLTSQPAHSAARVQPLQDSETDCERSTRVAREGGVGGRETWSASN